MSVSSASEPLVVEKIVPGGDGFLHLPDGRSLFVPRSAPGDVIRLQRVHESRGRLRASDYELLTPSADRVRPECEVADRCGGCDLMHLGRETELREKTSMLREALARVGGQQVPDAIVEGAEVVAASAAAGYRSRVRFHIKAGKIGFYGRGSHELVEIPSCLVAEPQLSRALATVRKLARRFPDALACFSELEMRAALEGEAQAPRVFARFIAEDGIRPVRAEPFLRALYPLLRVVASEREARLLFERRPLPQGGYLEVPADAFSQVNRSVNVELCASVVEGAASRELTTFCDLFAGSGNFALALAERGMKGTLVEKSDSALAAAERVARAQGFPRLRFLRGDAAARARELAKDGVRFELVVLDPPRDGAADVLAALPDLATRTVAYVACDPVTLSRDLKSMLALGFRLTGVHGFDMFPRTHHFETLAWLER